MTYNKLIGNFSENPCYFINNSNRVSLTEVHNILILHYEGDNFSYKTLDVDAFEAPYDKNLTNDGTNATVIVRPCRKFHLSSFQTNPTKNVVIALQCLCAYAIYDALIAHALIIGACALHLTMSIRCTSFVS